MRLLTVSYDLYEILVMCDVVLSNSINISILNLLVNPFTPEFHKHHHEYSSLRKSGADEMVQCIKVLASKS